MPPINITPLGAFPGRPKPQAPAVPPITGQVFALKDGSGYAALASDGNYYRVDAGGGHGLTFPRSGGFVDVSMVDLAHGPVKTTEAGPHHATRAATERVGAHSARQSDDGVEVRLSGNVPRDGLPAPQPALDGVGHAVANSRETHALIVQQPGAAVDSQANLSPQSVLSLLD